MIITDSLSLIHKKKKYRIAGTVKMFNCDRKNKFDLNIYYYLA